jgi:hypothetical protein
MDDFSNPVRQEQVPLTMEEAEEAEVGHQHAAAMKRMFGQDELPPANVLRRLSRYTAFKYQVMPVAESDGLLHCLTCEVLDVETKLALETEAGVPVQLHQASREQIEHGLRLAYPDPIAPTDDDDVKERQRAQGVESDGWLNKLMNRFQK